MVSQERKLKQVMSPPINSELFTTIVFPNFTRKKNIFNVTNGLKEKTKAQGAKTRYGL